MEIKKIQIKNFKSIKEITLEGVSPLMVLVGANGSGKSNFADALKFIGLVNKYSLVSTLENENYSFNPESIKNRNLDKEEDKPNKIEFNFKFLNKEDKTYSIDLEKPSNFDSEKINKQLKNWKNFRKL